MYDRPATIELDPLVSGGAVSGRWVQARHVQPGDLLISAERGPVVVEEVTTRPEATTIYNLHVARIQTYTVGHGALWVHNLSVGNPCPGAPFRGKPGQEIDPTHVDVFRGGTDLKVKPGEITIDKQTGLVQPTKGVSLENDPTGLGKFGGAHKVKSIPPELKIIQRGKRDTHFEIVPRQPMTPERFQELVNQVVLQ